ncbi:MAG: SH3 domain-containing protein [Anaerolineales bacterium]|nr:SH3 domain-containing protein [Anaerolineales bacterium]
MAKKLPIVFSVLLLLVAMGLFLEGTDLVAASESFQQPTVSIPTVTGTPKGPFAIVYSDPEDQINVRSGPDVFYPKVGVLINRQEVPALAKTEGGTWVKIVYPGVPEGVAWVYAPYVRITGELPVVPKPPTPTPETTPTIDPTLASQFISEIPPTRKPTFTPPPPLIVPTYEAVALTSGTGGLPSGFIILGLISVGIFGLAVSFLRRS